MKIIIFNVIFFCLFAPLNAKELKMCVIYEKTVPTREIKINLEEMYINNEIEMKNIRENIGNGECFAVPIPKSIEMVEQIECVFGIFVKPLMESDNAFWPNGGGAGEESTDNGPFEDQLLDFRVDDIRTMYRTSRMALHAPNLCHRYTVNLGKIDPPGLFLNRRVFVEPTKNGSGGARNYHALLYAVSSKNRRHFDYASSLLFYEKIFVGYAPFVKIKNGQMEEGEASEKAEQRQNQLAEYLLSVPINAGRLFKHKIWNLKLEIFYFEQEQRKNFNDGKENAIKRREAENGISDCPICLDNLKTEKLTMQFHEDLNQNCQHMFHHECIIKWIEIQQKIRCPICNLEPKFLMETNVYAIFNGDGEILSTISMNPMADLFKMANGQMGGEQFKQNQAQLGIRKMDELLHLKERALKELIRKSEILDNNGQLISLINGHKLFEISARGLQESPIIGQIKNELENVQQNGPNSFFVRAKEITESIEKMSELEILAQSEFENLQHIIVEN